MNLKHNIFLTIAMAISIISFGQNNSSKNLPKTKIDVQKKIDEHGNIIMYDSTYSYSYSSTNNPLNINIDSLLQEFNTEFNLRSSFFLPFQDSAFHHFPNPDFFQQFNRNNNFFEEDLQQFLQKQQRFLDNFFHQPKQQIKKKEEKEITL